MIAMTSDGAAANGDESYATRSSLHEDIERAVRNEMRRIEALDPTLSSTLRSELRSVCADAKRLHMRSELLVIAIKKVWQAIPEARSFARPSGMDALLNDAVTMVLDEFYDTSPLAGTNDD